MTDPAGRADPGQRPAPARPHFTGRAAVLAVVLCAIALSLAYPVREYLAQRRQIDVLLAQGARIAQRQRFLRAEQARLKTPGYIEQQARDRLHMCLPTQMCYVVIDPRRRHAKGAAGTQAATPWYGRLWSSVQQANAGSAGKARPSGKSRPYGKAGRSTQRGGVRRRPGQSGRSGRPGQSGRAG